MGEDRRAGVIKKKEQRNTEQKLHYEKPKLTPVSLFADQVLSGCAKQYPNFFCTNYGKDLTS